MEPACWGLQRKTVLERYQIDTPFLKFVEQLAQAMSGATQSIQSPDYDATDLERPEFVVPPKELTDAFEHFCASAHDRCEVSHLWKLV